MDYDYLTQFYSDREIEDLHRCLLNILQEALYAQERPIYQLSVLGSEEREQVLYTCLLYTSIAASEGTSADGFVVRSIKKRTKWQKA